MSKNEVSLKFAQFQNLFFKKPVLTGLSFWFSSSVILLFPTCFILVPSGTTQRNAKGERDTAQDDVNQQQNRYNGIIADRTESEQRIRDLDCAKAGYQAFNQGAANFQNSLSNTNLTAMNLIQSFGQSSFDADSSKTDTNTQQLSWVTHTTAIVNKVLIRTPHHHYYNQVTNILNVYKNILNGGGYKLPILNCGFYSRALEFYAPQTYLVSESPHTTSGTMTSGKVSINFRRDYGSRVPVKYQLDDLVVNPNIIVARDVTQDMATIDLGNQLTRFLAMGVAAFNMVGTNYTAVQEGIRNRLPVLEDMALVANTTLQAKSKVLASKEGIFAGADSQYSNDLSLWLSLLFVVPAVIGVCALIFAAKYPRTPAVLAQDPSDIEMHSAGSENSSRRDSDDSTTSTSLTA